MSAPVSLSLSLPSHGAPLAARSAAVPLPPPRATEEERDGTSERGERNGRERKEERGGPREVRRRDEGDPHEDLFVLKE